MATERRKRWKNHTLETLRWNADFPLLVPGNNYICKNEAAAYARKKFHKAAAGTTA
jgi:hypothetical protein